MGEGEVTNSIDKILAAIVALALIGAVGALAWHGTVDGQAVVGFFTGLSLAGIVGGVQHVSTRNGASAATAGVIAASSASLDPLAATRAVRDTLDGR